MNERSLAKLDQILVSCARELFAGHGVTVSEQTTAPARKQGHDAATYGFGFASEKLRGYLWLTLTPGLVRECMPRELAPEAAADLVSDWMRELCSQLLGRVKNRLVSEGVVLGLSLPVLFFGETAIRRRGPARTLTLAHDLNSPGGHGSFWVDMEFAEGIELGEVEAADQAEREGGLRLF